MREMQHTETAFAPAHSPHFRSHINHEKGMSRRYARRPRAGRASFGVSARVPATGSGGAASGRGAGAEPPAGIPRTGGGADDLDLVHTFSEAIVPLGIAQIRAPFTALREPGGAERHAAETLFATSAEYGGPGVSAEL